MTRSRQNRISHILIPLLIIALLLVVPSIWKRIKANAASQPIHDTLVYLGSAGDWEIAGTVAYLDDESTETLEKNGGRNAAGYLVCSPAVMTRLQGSGSVLDNPNFTGLAEYRLTFTWHGESSPIADQNMLSFHFGTANGGIMETYDEDQRVLLSEHETQDSFLSRESDTVFVLIGIDFAMTRGSDARILTGVDNVTVTLLPEDT